MEQSAAARAGGGNRDTVQVTTKANQQLKTQVARLSLELASLTHERDVLLGQVLAGPGGADELPDLLHKLQTAGSPGVPGKPYSGASSIPYNML